MCRSKELGGRRCPQHTDPVKHVAYNKHRREMYALKKQLSVEQQIDPYSKYIDFDVERIYYKYVGPEAEQFEKEAKEFMSALTSSFDYAGWRDDEDWRLKDFTTEIKDSPTALLYYTGDGFKTIRNYLSQGSVMNSDKKRKYSDEEKTWLNGVVDQLDSAVAQAKKPSEPRLLYRGMRIPLNIRVTDVEGWLRHAFPEGGVISQPNFMSTSLNAYTAAEIFSPTFSNDGVQRGVIFEIVSKQGAALGEGLAVSGLREKEVLMPRNAKFKVVEVKKQVLYKFVSSFGMSKQERRTVIRLMDVDEDNK